MSKKQGFQSVEPNVVDTVTSWLKEYGLDYKLEQEEMNSDIDNALKQYLSKTGGKGGKEVIDLVRYGRKKLNIFTDKEYYEGNIDPENGADWNQSAPIDTTPTLEDFKNTVSDYLAWEVSNILKSKNDNNDSLGK